MLGFLMQTCRWRRFVRVYMIVECIHASRFFVTSPVRETGTHHSFVYNDEVFFDASSEYLDGHEWLQRRASPSYPSRASTLHCRRTISLLHRCCSDAARRFSPQNGRIKGDYLQHYSYRGTTAEHVGAAREPIRTITYMSLRRGFRLCNECR